MKIGENPGFTLLELLVTLVLFATIITLLLGSFVQLQDQDSDIAAVLKMRQEARILEKMIRRDFQATVYLTEYMRLKPVILDDRQSGIVSISNDYDNMNRDVVHMHVHKPSDFIRTLNISADPEIHEVSYFIDDMDETKLMFKRREEFYIDNNITDGDRSVVHTLSRNVIEFDLQYFREKEAGKQEEWDSESEAKNNRNPIPTGLEVNMVFKNETGATLKSSFQIITTLN